MLKITILINAILLVTSINLPSQDSTLSAGGLFQRDNLTGNWGGNRTFLEDQGVSFQFDYKGEIWYAQQIGSKSEWCYTDNYNLIADIDFDKVFGWSSTHFFTHVLGNNGRNVGDFVGSAQGVSNIAAYNTWKIFEFYLETEFWEKRINIILGLYDLNSQFDSKTANQLFINPSHGIGVDWSQSGENGPSIFPTSALGVRLKINPITNIYFEYSIMDGIPGDVDNPNGTRIILDPNDGLLNAAEIGYTMGSKDRDRDETDKKHELYCKYAFGFWNYTDNYSHVFTHQKSHGAYFFAEQDIFNEKMDPRQGLTFEGRIGFADGRGYQIDLYVGSGLVYKGLIPGRDEDELGVSVANALKNTSGYYVVDTDSNYGIKSCETIYEITYKFLLTPAIAFQPDFQYILSPFDSDYNASVFGMRVMLNF